MSVFLLGAGFNIDANQEAASVYGNSIYAGQYKIDYGYPLVADVVRLCFGLDEVPLGKSVEDLFSDALRGGDYKPLKRLVDRLMEADYRLGAKLAYSSKSNSYREFFEKFSDAQFLTFNYDSLPEIFLSQMGRWYPEDGYGVPVAIELAFGAKLPANTRSTSLVLHLHGSSCVYTSEFEIRGKPAETVAQLVHRARPLYGFDPDSISSCFPRYRRMVSNTGLVRIEERVIAPVPGKSQDLKQVFIGEIYAKALSRVRESGNLISVGYSFNGHDRLSYGPILQALSESSGRKLFIVSPESSKLAVKIQMEYLQIQVKPIENTFRGWAIDSFRCD